MYYKKDADVMRFCLDRGIRIVPIPSSGDKLSLEIHSKGKPQKSKQEYTKDNMTEKIIELYHILADRNGYKKASEKVTE